MTMHPALTPRQRDVLNFMRTFHAENDQLPPMHVVSARFGWKSTNAAQCYADILEAKGYIEKNAVGKYRFTREEQPAAVAMDTLPGALLRLPVLDSIPVRRFIGT